MNWLDRRGACALVLFALPGLVACGPSRVALDDTGDDSGSGSTGETGTGAATSGPATVTTTAGTTGTPGTAVLELGFGQFPEFRPLEDGGEMDLVVGGQGLFMFPVPLRGSGFHVPPVPYDYNHPEAPLLDIELDVQGLEGIGGHFIYLANYPIPFEDWGDTYQFYYVALLLPDEVGGEAVDPVVLEGRAAHLTGRLRPFGGGPVTVEYDLTLRADVPG